MRPFLAEVQEKILRMRQELHTCPKCGLRQRIEDTHQKHIRKGLWCAKCKQYKSYTHFLEARKKQCRGKIKQFHCPICHLRLTKLCIKGHIKTVHKFSSEEAKLVPQLCPAVQQGTDLALTYFRQVANDKAVEEGQYQELQEASIDKPATVFYLMLKSSFF